MATAYTGLRPNNRKAIMKIYLYPLFVFILLSGFHAMAQDPVMTVRFANPQFDCETGNYCLDVEFQSDTPGQQVFGMNVRFFFDDSVLQFLSFTDFESGYGPVLPNPPELFTSELGPGLFAFNGAATYLEGAVQLLNQAAEPINISTTDWTRLFSVCFSIKDPSALNQDDFCPSVVWDLNSEQSGTIIPNSGSQGVVITAVSEQEDMQSKPTTENVVQFNWAYSASAGQPFGTPVELACLSTVCLEESPDITINKTASPLTFEAVGDVINYTIAVINTGAFTLTDVLVSDPLTGLNTIIPSLVPGSAQLFTETYTITAIDLARGYFTNVATATGTDPDGNMVSDTDDATVTVVTDEPTETELVVTKTTTESLVMPGDMVTFVIEVTNIGETAALNTIITDVLATQFTFISASGDGSYNPDNRTVSWLVDDIPVDGLVTLELMVRVHDNAVIGQTITNQAFATSDNSRPAASCVAQVIVVGEADLSIAKSADRQQARAGEPVTYTLFVTNNGPSTAMNVRVADNLPTEVIFVSAQHNGVYFQESHTIEWMLGNMEQGETIAIEIAVSLHDDTPEGISVINYANVAGDISDPNPVNNTALHILTVTGPRADLAVSKTTPESTIRAAEELVYTITLTNLGPDDADQVVVTDTLPSDISFISANENGLYDPLTHTVQWTFSYLVPGETIIMEVTTRVDSETPMGTIIRNMVNASTTTTDPNLDNNRAFVEVEVLPTDLNIPDVFSPNNDGINDRFVIRGLDRYPNNSLIIINRWGNKVFEAAPYNNDWDGTNQFGITVGGDDLPVGTYYYIFDFGETGGRQERGFIYLTR